MLPILSQNSLSILRKNNSKFEGRILHEHTHVLYDLRTSLGEAPKTYLEIGSYVGSSACLMLSHPYKTKVYCVDPCLLYPSHSSTLFENLQRVKNESGNTFEILTKFSCEKTMLEILEELKIDILFIDGDHSYQGVSNDFNNYSKYIVPGGYIVFDDYFDAKYCPEVRPAVDNIVSTLSTEEYEIIDSIENTFKASPENFPYLNEFILRKKQNLFAVVIPTYQRKNGKTIEYVKRLSEMLKKQTYSNFKVFLIGDNYEDENEFLSLVSLFPRKQIYFHNNSKSYREGYFKEGVNKWCIGGVMAIEYGVRKAKELDFQYYLHLDDDDIWSSNKMEIIKDTITKFPEADFIYHASNYLNRVLPNECDEHIEMKYNNLIPRNSNIVHSTNVLSLKDENYNIFMNYTHQVMQHAENIKNSVVSETKLYAFDAGIIDLFTSKPIKFLFIPKILSSKENDGNVPY